MNSNLINRFLIVAISSSVTILFFLTTSEPIRTQVIYDCSQRSLSTTQNQVAAKPDPADATFNRLNGKLLPSLSARHPSHSLNHLPVSNLWAYITRSILAYRIAHFDDRKSAYGGPVLIVLALHNTHVESSFPTHVLFAKVVYSNGTEKCLNNSHGTYTRLRAPKTDEFVQGYTIFFRLPTNERPTAAFICTKVDCSSHSAHLTVFWEEPPATKLDFAVCLHQAIFQQSDHEEVAAWLEMNRALGAQKVTLYYQDISTNVVETIQKYVDEGFVDAFDWFNNITTEADNNFGQSILIMDCFYRNLHRTKYLVFHDFDEIMMPHQSSTWHGLMETIDKDPSVSNFRFCHSLFHDTSEVMPILDETEHKENGCSKLQNIPVMFKRIERTAKPNCFKWTRWKTMIVPSKIKIMAIHSAGSCKGYKRFDVPTDIALLHHYRHKEYQIDEDKVQDFTAHKYMKGVINNLIEKFCD